MKADGPVEKQFGQASYEVVWEEDPCCRDVKDTEILKCDVFCGHGKQNDKGEPKTTHFQVEGYNGES